MPAQLSYLENIDGVQRRLDLEDVGSALEHSPMAAEAACSSRPPIAPEQLPLAVPAFQQQHQQQESPQQQWQLHWRQQQVPGRAVLAPANRQGAQHGTSQDVLQLQAHGMGHNQEQQLLLQQCKAQEQQDNAIGLQSPPLSQHRHQCSEGQPDSSATCGRAEQPCSPADHGAVAAPSRRALSFESPCGPSSSAARVMLDVLADAAEVLQQGQPRGQEASPQPHQLELEQQFCRLQLTADIGSNGSGGQISGQPGLPAAMAGSEPSSQRCSGQSGPVLDWQRWEIQPSLPVSAQPASLAELISSCPLLPAGSAAPGLLRLPSGQGLQVPYDVVAAVMRHQVSSWHSHLLTRCSLLCQPTNCTHHALALCLLLAQRT